MNLISKAALLTAAMIVALPAASMAGTATGNIQVTANVQGNCTIATKPLAFGAYDPLGANAVSGADLAGSTTIGVTCTKGTTPTVSVAAGTNVATVGSAVASSAMALTPAVTGSLPLNYTFALLGNTAANAGGINAPYSFPLNGTVAKGQDVANGSYQDNLVATVSF